MAKKILFQTQLTELKLTDLEGIGVIREDSVGNSYTWVKNSSATALVSKEPCFWEDADENRVTPMQAVNRFAGVPETAIAASGSTYTGSFGWVQRSGVVEDCILQGTDTAQAVGAVFVASTGNFIFKSAGGTAPVQVPYAVAATAVATTSGLATENSTDLKLIGI